MRSEQARLDKMEHDYEMKLTPFQRWFKTFLEEKEIDMSDYLTAGDNTNIQVGDVCTMIMNTNAFEQIKIRDTLTVIDYQNGNAMTYLAHLAKALSKKDKIGI